MTIHHRVAQGSAEWMQLRIGLPTASEFHRIVTPARCDLSKQSRKYAFRLIAEKLLNENLTSLEGLEYVTQGKEKEPAAVRMYEFENGIATEACGLFTTDDGRIGASPDRLIVGQPACVELKCPASFTHLEWMVDGFGADYVPQVQGQMLVGEFEFADRYSYFPLWPPVPCRTYRDEEYIAKLRSALDQFCDMKDELFERIKASGVFAEPHTTIRTAIDNLRDQEVIDGRANSTPMQVHMFDEMKRPYPLTSGYESEEIARMPTEVEMLKEIEPPPPMQWFFVVTDENGEEKGYESSDDAEAALKSALIEASCKGRWELEACAKENAYTMNDLLPEAAQMRLKHELEQLRGSFERDPDTLEMFPATHGSPELDADAAKLEALGADPGPVLADFKPAAPPQERAPAVPMQVPNLGGGAPTSSEGREVPMVFLRGKPGLPDYRTWFDLVFMKWLKREPSKAAAAFLLGANHRHLDGYYATLTPADKIAVQERIADVLDGLPI